MMQIAQQSRQKSNSRQSKAVRRREAMKKIVKETKSDNLVEKGKKDKKLTVITKMEGSSNNRFILYFPFDQLNKKYSPVFHHVIPGYENNEHKKYTYVTFIKLFG